MVQCDSGYQALELIEPRTLRTVLTQPLAPGHEIDAIACALLPTLDPSPPDSAPAAATPPVSAPGAPHGEPPPLPTVSHGSRVAALHTAERAQRFTCMEHLVQASSVYRGTDEAEASKPEARVEEVLHLLTVFKPRLERFPGQAKVRCVVLSAPRFRASAAMKSQGFLRAVIRLVVR